MLGARHYARLYIHYPIHTTTWLDLKGIMLSLSKKPVSKGYNSPKDKTIVTRFLGFFGRGGDVTILCPKCDGGYTNPYMG